MSDKCWGVVQIYPHNFRLISQFLVEGSRAKFAPVAILQRAAFRTPHSKNSRSSRAYVLVARVSEADI